MSLASMPESKYNYVRKLKVSQVGFSIRITQLLLVIVFYMSRIP